MMRSHPNQSLKTAIATHPQNQTAIAKTLTSKKQLAIVIFELCLRSFVEAHDPQTYLFLDVLLII
jgi:hypothetical protein